MAENLAYDPELVWNVEGPTRKVVEQAKRKADGQDIMKVNTMQREQFYQRRIDQRNLDIEEGKRLVRSDLQDVDLEKQLVQFKKQLFA